MGDLVVRPIAEEGKGEAQALGKGPGRGVGVDAYTQDLGIGLLELPQGVLEAR